jgi:hypothetical protein
LSSKLFQVEARSELFGLDINLRPDKLLAVIIGLEPSILVVEISVNVPRCLDVASPMRNGCTLHLIAIAINGVGVERVVERCIVTVLLGQNDNLGKIVYGKNSLSATESKCCLSRNTVRG